MSAISVSRLAVLVFVGLAVLEPQCALGRAGAERRADSAPPVVSGAQTGTKLPYVPVFVTEMVGKSAVLPGCDVATATLAFKPYGSTAQLRAAQAPARGAAAAVPGAEAGQQAGEAAETKCSVAPLDVPGDYVVASNTSATPGFMRVRAIAEDVRGNARLADGFHAADPHDGDEVASAWAPAAAGGCSSGSQQCLVNHTSSGGLSISGAASPDGCCGVATSLDALPSLNPFNEPLVFSVEELQASATARVAVCLGPTGPAPVSSWDCPSGSAGLFVDFNAANWSVEAYALRAETQMAPWQLSRKTIMPPTAISRSSCPSGSPLSIAVKLDRSRTNISVTCNAENAVPPAINASHGLTMHTVRGVARAFVPRVF